MAGTGAPLKPLESYLVSATAHKTSLSAYAACPASSFLRYVCDANDAHVHCKNKFTKKIDGSYHKDSEDSLRHLSCSILSTVMGHFETYQKCLFAGLFERTRFLPKFEVKSFISTIEKRTGGSIDISPARLAAYRGITAPVGLVVADSLKGWHSPDQVNAYFTSFELRQKLFSNKDVENLSILWQLRHSIVHTGAWLTHPDSQKVSALAAHADKAIVFEHTFVNAVARRLHKLVKGANARVDADFKALLGAAAPSGVLADFNRFIAVSSPTPTWL